MNRRIAVALGIGAALILIAVVEVSIFVPILTEVCSKNLYTGQNDCETRNLFMAIIEYINSYGVAITAVATVAIGLFTMTLWRATTEQAKLTRQSIDLTRAEFNAAYRPKIILRESFAVVTDMEVPIVVQYRLTNIGGTRAWIVHSFLDLEIVAKGLWLTPDSTRQHTPTYIGAIAPGESIELTFSSNNHVWDRQHRDALLSDDPLGLHFVGHLIYIDEPGSSVQRQTAFRRRYDREMNRFRIIWEGENAYEYAD